MEWFPYISETTPFFLLFFFRLSTLGSIITKQGFAAIFGEFSTKCFKFYLYLPIIHFFLASKSRTYSLQPTWIDHCLVRMWLNLIKDWILNQFNTVQYLSFGRKTRLTDLKTFGLMNLRTIERSPPVRMISPPGNWYKRKWS